MQVIGECCAKHVGMLFAEGPCCRTVFKANILNGQPVVRGDGTDWLTSTGAGTGWGTATARNVME